MSPRWFHDNRVHLERERARNVRFTLLCASQRAKNCSLAYFRHNSTYEVKKALKIFLGTIIPDRVYVGGAQEYRTAAEELGISFEPCTPYRWQSTGVAENVVKKVEEGTACALLQSGFDLSWWNEAMRLVL